MSRHRYSRYRRPQHPQTAWLFFAIGALMVFIGALNSKPSNALLLTMTGSTIAGLAGMYLFPWYAVKHVLRDRDLEKEDFREDD